MGTHHKPTFYGTATIGTKGQIVIPADAREELNLQPGEKVVVFGVKEHGMVGVCKYEAVEEMFARMSAHLETVRAVLDASKKEDKKGN